MTDAERHRMVEIARFTELIHNALEEREYEYAQDVLSDLEVFVGKALAEDTQGRVEYAADMRHEAAKGN